MGNFDLERVLTFLPGIILGLTVHEYCHALVAHMCGDSTSKEQGRVTLNPLKHIDPIGFMMLIFVGFGWAKPVQFNEQNLRNPKTDVLKIVRRRARGDAVAALAAAYGMTRQNIRHTLSARPGIPSPASRDGSSPDSRAACTR